MTRIKLLTTVDFGGENNRFPEGTVMEYPDAKIVKSLIANGSAKEVSEQETTVVQVNPQATDGQTETDPNAQPPVNE